MKHIKIFEDYSDEELGDLIGDLRGIGHHDLKFDVVSQSYYRSEREKEENFARNYKGGVGIISVEGSLGGVFLVNLHIVLSNGDEITLKVPMYEGHGEPEMRITGNGLDPNKNYENLFFRFGNNKSTYIEGLMEFYKKIKANHKFV